MKKNEWIIVTKLSSPAARDDLIPRPQLLETLEKAVFSHKLTLISAPAGYGKTTLLTAWLNARPDLPIAWLSLDAGDNDLALLFAYLDAALRSLDPAFEAPALPLLPGPPNDSDYARRGIGALINAVQHTLPAPFALILDDLHLLTQPTIYIALDYLLERLPAQMHLVIATRRDPPLPLARLRARGQLAELRRPDLRFTYKEAATLLNAALRSRLAPDELNTLYAHTEGWAAGLRLMITSLDTLASSDEQAAFITQLIQSQRFISEFLLQEVLNRQDETIRSFLLRTSILPILDVPLCRAVTGRDDVQQILAELERRNLLVAVVDQDRLVWRYPNFIAEFLRQCLTQETPADLAELHRRAAKAERFPDRAIAHYLAAELWTEAAQAIEQIGDALLTQGLLTTLRNWLNALPAPVCKASPQLLYLLGACTWHQEEHATGQMCLESALQGFESAGDAAGQGKVLAVLSNCVTFQGDVARGQTLMERALAGPLSPPTRVQLLTSRAWLSLLTDKPSQSVADLEAAWTTARRGRDSDLLHQLVLYSSPALAALPENLAYLERVCRRAAAVGVEGHPLVKLMLQDILSFTHMRRGRWDQSIQVGESGLALSQQWGGHPLIDADILFTLLTIHAACGEYGAANRYAHRLAHQVELTVLDPTYVCLHRYLLGRTAWLQTHISKARQIYVEMEAVAAPTESPTTNILCRMLHGLLEMSAGNHAAAERDFREAASVRQFVPFSDLVGSPRLLLAHLYHTAKRPDDALAELTPVLARSQQAQIPALILQEGAIVAPLLRLAIERDLHTAYAERLLGILTPAARPLRIPESGETLTPREVEILQLVAAGASNRAIAEQLVISPHTVKTHVSHILQKLGVSSRAQAAVRFQRLRRDA